MQESGIGMLARVAEALRSNPQKLAAARGESMASLEPLFDGNEAAAIQTS